MAYPTHLGNTEGYQIQIIIDFNVQSLQVLFCEFRLSVLRELKFVKL